MLNEIIELSKEVKKEKKALLKKYGIDNDINGCYGRDIVKKRFEYYKADKPCFKKYEDYLLSLSDEDLALTEAVMYGGRDAYPKGRALPLEDMLEQLKDHSREGKLHSIIGKSRVDNYLRAGIEAYK